LKIIKVFCLLFFGVALLLPLDARASQEREVTILFTGDTMGRVWPGKWCASDPFTTGGLARRANMIHWFKGDAPNILLLDSGGIFPPTGTKPMLRSEITLKAMKQMNYSATTLAPKDLSMELSLLKQMSRDRDLPAVTTNLVFKDTGKPFGSRYEILRIGDVTIAVIGVIDPGAIGAYGNDQLSDLLEILPPEEAIRNALSEIGEQTDLVVLLSRLSTESYKAIANVIDDIDLVIRGAKNQAQYDVAADPKDKVVFTGFRGSSVGIAHLIFDETGEVLEKSYQMIPLDESVESDENITEMIEDAYHQYAEKQRQKRKEARFKAISESLKQDLRLTPEEYIKKQMNEHKREE
jgi:2',3'-cyclic-nucleotide 2'-phosphodiesterase (5'-nucleotidase family)